MELLIKLVEKQQSTIEDINAKFDMLSTKLNNACERIESLKKNDKHKLIPFPDDFMIYEDATCYNQTQSFNKYIKTELYKRFDTSNVTDMSCMFSECKSLVHLDLSNWDTSKVTDMSWMFSGCTSLTTLDLSQAKPGPHSSASRWNTSRAELESCFSTSKVTNMSLMFSECTSLVYLDLSNWDTSKVTNMGSMFCDCASLTYLDLSNWDTSNVTNMNYMFDGCNLLQTIIVTNQVTYDMLTKVKPLHTIIKLVTE